MNLFTKRFGLVLAGVIGVGAVASLAMGASFALFSASQTGAPPSTFTAGTVSFSTGNAGTSGSCVETNLAPGDSTPDYTQNGVNPGNGQAGLPGQECNTFGNYTGSLQAYIGVEINITSQSAEGSWTVPANDNPILYLLSPGDGCVNTSANLLAPVVVCPDYALVNTTDPFNNNAQQELRVEGDNYGYSGPEITNSDLTTTCKFTGSVTMGTSQQTCTSTTTGPQLIGNTTQKPGTTPSPESWGIQLDYYLPYSASNGYQGATASVNFTFDAAQCANNGATVGAGGHIIPIPQAIGTTYQNATCAAADPANWS